MMGGGFDAVRNGCGTIGGTIGCGIIRGPTSHLVRGIVIQVQRSGFALEAQDINRGRGADRSFANRSGDNS